MVACECVPPTWEESRDGRHRLADMKVGDLVYLPNRFDQQHPGYDVACAITRPPGRIVSIEGGWAMVDRGEWGQFGCPVDELTPTSKGEDPVSTVPESGSDGGFDVEWTQVSDRAYISAGSIAGDWTLVCLSESPRNRDSGPGWYLYGPDVTALRLDAGSSDAAIARATTQVHAYVTVERARSESFGAGPAVPEGVREAVHARLVGQVVIFCDRCGVQAEGDFTGATREARFEAARRHLELRKGWECGVEDLCPACRTRTSSSF
jgi:hypothetical protein